MGVHRFASDDNDGASVAGLAIQNAARAGPVEALGTCSPAINLKSVLMYLKGLGEGHICAGCCSAVKRCQDGQT